jgi:hypothetical protein
VRSVRRSQSPEDDAGRPASIAPVSDGRVRQLRQRAISYARRAAKQACGDRVPDSSAIARLPPSALAYRDLSPFSLHFDRVEFGRGSPGVNVLVPTAAPAKIFAGIRTALVFARQVALELDRPLRIVTINPNGSPGDRKRIEQTLAADLKVRHLGLVRLGDHEVLNAAADDVWIVTHWTTAHAADVARRVGVIEARRVVYLVQDYEPGFEPWSSNHALVRATYHAGFHLAVNSRPLARHLASQEDIAIDDASVFSPDLDASRLEQAAALRRPAPHVRVLFYARPSKPRNLFALGVSALRRADDLLGDRRADVQVMAAGEPTGDVALGPGRTVTGLGNVGWDGYYRLLSEVDVGLSLMYSPHPSHPPLDLAISGARVVTNDFAGARAALHPRLIAPAPDPDALAAAVVDAVGQAREQPAPPYVPLAEGLLGRPITDVAARCAGATAP